MFRRRREISRQERNAAEHRTCGAGGPEPQKCRRKETQPLAISRDRAVHEQPRNKKQRPNSKQKHNQRFVQKEEFEIREQPEAEVRKAFRRVVQVVGEIGHDVVEVGGCKDAQERLFPAFRG